MAVTVDEITANDAILSVMEPFHQKIFEPIIQSSTPNFLIDNCTLDAPGPLESTTLNEAIFRILYSAIPILIAAFTVVGNTFVIVAICINKRLARKHTSILILNLAAADLLVGSGVMPLAIVQILTDSRWIFGRIVCRIWTALDVICCTASIFTLCIISVDRYIGVTRPLAYSYMVTRERLTAAVLLVWVFSIGVLLITVQWAEGDCRDSSVCHVGNELQYVAHSVVMSFFIPLFIILIVYYKIYRVTRRRESSLLHVAARRKPVIVTSSPSLQSYSQLKNRGSANPMVNGDESQADCTGGDTPQDGGSPCKKSSTVIPIAENIPTSTSWTLVNGIRSLKRRVSSASLFTADATVNTQKMPLRIHYGGPFDGDVNKQRKVYQKHKKTAKTLSLVVGAFLLSWVPFFILYLISNICDDHCIPTWIMDIFTWLGYSNSAINPIIYAVSMRTFGDTMRLTLRRFIYYPVRDLLTTHHANRDLSIVVGSDQRQSRYSYAGVGAPTISGSSMNRQQSRSTMQRSQSLSETTNLSLLTKSPVPVKSPTPNITYSRNPQPAVTDRFLHPNMNSRSSPRPPADPRPSRPSADKKSAYAPSVIGARLRLVGRSAIMINRWRTNKKDREKSPLGNEQGPSQFTGHPPDPVQIPSGRFVPDKFYYSSQFTLTETPMGTKKMASDMRGQSSTDSYSSIDSSSSDEGNWSVSPRDHSKMSCSGTGSWYSAGTKLDA